jgi:tetratricopeptide (TPR) repeat protein
MKWRRKLLPWLLLLVPVAGVGYFGGRYLWADYHYRAGWDAAAKRSFSQAREHFELCLLVWPRNSEVHLLAARAARQAGAFAEAGRHLDECERLEGPTPSVALERLMGAAQQGSLSPDGEAALLTAARQNVVQTPLILEALTQAYLSAYRLGEALACVSRLLELEPDHVPARVWRGWICEGMRRFEDAEADYRKAVDLDPDHVDARLRLAELLLTFKRVPEASRTFERLRREHPDNAAVRFGLARCRLVAGRAAEARELLLTLARDKPDDAGVLRALGQAALSQGKPAEAEPWLRRAVKADPFDPETLYALAQCLVKCNQPEEARKVADRRERLEADLKELAEIHEQTGKNPRDPDLRCRAGVICLRNGQAAEGLRWLSGALQIDARHQRSHQALAKYFADKGKPELAEHHRRLAEAGPK